MSGHKIQPPPLRPWQSAGFSFKKDKQRSVRGRTRADHAVAAGLEAIYAKGGDLASFDRRQTHPWRRFTFGTVAGLAAIALLWGAYALFISPLAKKGSAALSLQISGPSSISLGREETFEVRYANRAQTPIVDAALRLNAPPEFTLTYVEPAFSLNQTRSWRAPRIMAGEEGIFTVKGIFLGELGARNAIQVIGTYSEAALKGEPLEAIATLPVSYEQSELTGVIALPNKVVTGEPFEISYSVKNDSYAERNDLAVRWKLPVGFALSASSSASLTPVEGAAGFYELALPALTAKSTSTLRFFGAFVSGSSGNQKFEARLGSPSSANFAVFNKDEKTLPVLSEDLSLRLVVNGSSSDRLIAPGENLRLAISYENLSPETISGVSLILKFESLKDGESATGTSWLDWSRLQNSAGAVSSTRERIQTLRFDEKTSPELARIAPQGKGSFDVSLPALFAVSGTRDARLVINLEGGPNKVGKNKVSRTISVAPIELRYRTDTAFSSQAFYFTEEGAPLGRGPLPPSVGTTTVYRVFWRIKKSLHELSDIAVSASLPSIASWSGNVLSQAGDLVYDENSRAVRWSVVKLPHDVNEIEASFEIKVMPTDLDVGRFAALLGEARFSATDLDTSETVLLSAPTLTSDLQNDEWASRKGVVRK